MIRDVWMMLFSFLVLCSKHCFPKGMKEIHRMCHHASVQPGAPASLSLASWGLSWDGVWTSQAAPSPAKMLRRILRRTARALSCVISSCSAWQPCLGLHRSLLREKCQTDWGWMTEDHKNRLPHSYSCCYYFWKISKCCAKQPMRKRISTKSLRVTGYETDKRKNRRCSSDTAPLIFFLSPLAP